MKDSQPFTLQLSKVSNADVAKVGGKNASLGEMIQHLQDAGIRVPGGFATTAQAYWHFLDSNALRKPIADKLALFANGEVSLEKTGDAIRGLIRKAEFAGDLAAAIRSAYQTLAKQSGEKQPAVAVRSSATAEDLPQASFAGQQETYLNDRGPKIAACVPAAVLKYRSSIAIRQPRDSRPCEIG